MPGESDPSPSLRSGLRLMRGGVTIDGMPPDDRGGCPGHEVNAYGGDPCGILSGGQVCPVLNALIVSCKRHLCSVTHAVIAVTLNVLNY